MPRRSLIVVAVLGSSFAAHAQDNLGKPAAVPVAQPATVNRTESGKGLVIPDEEKKLGAVYYTAPTAAKQVSFKSDGKIKFDGHSSGVIGYAVAGPADHPGDLKAGRWALPIKSLHTGNGTKDKHLAGEMWLDTSKGADVVFVLKEVRDLKPHKETPAGKSFSATLVGDLTMHGVTRPLMVPDTVLGFAGGTDKSPVKGDLLAIRCKYTVRLSEFGVSNTYTAEAKTVSDEVQIDQSLILSTVPPEQQPAAKAGEDPQSADR